MHAGVRVQRAGGPNGVVHTAGTVLIDNCTLSQNVGDDDSGGIVNANGLRAAVLLNRVAFHNNTGQRSLVTSEGGTMYSTKPGLQYFDNDTSEALPSAPAATEHNGLFLTFADPWLVATVAVRRARAEGLTICLPLSQVPFEF